MPRQYLNNEFIKLFHPIEYQNNLYIKSNAFGILKAPTLAELISKYKELMDNARY